MIDLDKARAARREAAGEAPVLRNGGKEFVLPVELPYECLEALRGLGENEKAPGALVGFAQALLGDQYEAWKEAAPLSMEDLNETIGGVMNAYGAKRPLPSSPS